jgi:CheY-like chemotaxis protein
VLVVDDNQTNRRILKEMLESWDMTVETVEGGPQAIEALQQAVTRTGSLPLIISDVHMPSMDGFMLAEKLRSTAAFREAVVILLTSGGRSGDSHRCEQLGISAHLIKPVKQSELLEAVIVAIGRQPARSKGIETNDDPCQTIAPLKILLAEDGKANQIMAVGLLTKWGHAVEIAENGEVAVAMWQAGSYDVILMDVQMPLLDGLEATAQIRELEAESHTPIIAMTARAMKGDRQRCLDAGMDDYVSKPVRRVELERVLRDLTLGVAEDTENQLATPADDSAQDCIDWNSALKNVAGDRELLLELLEVSIVENCSLFDQLEHALSQEQAKEAQRLAHTIKGGCQSIAAANARQAAAHVEAATEAGELATAHKQMAPLRQAIDRLNRVLKQAISSEGRLDIP